MSSIGGWLLAVGGYWTIVFLATDTAQRFLYDEVVGRLGLRSLLLAMPLGYLLVRWPLDAEDLDVLLLRGLLHFVLWFPGVWLVLRYQWRHAVGITALIVCLAAPILTIGIESVSPQASP